MPWRALLSVEARSFMLVVSISLTTVTIMEMSKYISTSAIATSTAALFPIESPRNTPLASRSSCQFYIEVDPTSPFAITDFASDGNIQAFLAIRLDHGGYLPTVRLAGRWRELSIEELPLERIIHPASHLHEPLAAAAIDPVPAE